MPCFDKKLEASREELTDRWWARDQDSANLTTPVRDVDCVITARELLTLCNDRGLNLQSLPLTPLPEATRVPFPNPTISRYLFPKSGRRLRTHDDPARSTEAGTSGGYLYHVLATQQSFHPGSTIHTRRGRNADVVEYTLLSSAQEPLLTCAKFYGFRNIQNLVRKLKPPRGIRLPGALAAKKGGKGGATNAGGIEYAYVEVMACPGGCTNGGGQIRMEEAIALQETMKGVDEEADDDESGWEMSSQRGWLKRVDSAYFSASPDSFLDDRDEDDTDDDMHDGYSNNFITNTVGGPSQPDQRVSIHEFLSYWSEYTSIPLEKLVYTSFRRVDSEVGKMKNGRSGSGTGDTERIAALAGSIGGGW